jgi:hypothetical protein
MKQHIQIKNSYNIWKPSRMKELIQSDSPLLIIEWWLHNIGYYLTLPLVKNAKIKALNERFKHVDLMVERKNHD